jgi:hypothetical protein
MPVLDLVPQADPQLVGSPPRAFGGDLDLHPNEEISVTLTTVIRDPNCLDAISTRSDPGQPVLRCRGVAVKLGRLETAAERRIAEAESAAVDAQRRLERGTRNLRLTIGVAFLAGVAVATVDSWVPGLRWLAQQATPRQALFTLLKVLAVAVLAVSGSMVAALLFAKPAKVAVREWRFRIWSAVTVLAAAITLL